MPRPQKPLLITLAVLTAAALGFGYFYFMEAGVPGKLYRHYPSSTGFYLEAAPGDDLMRRFTTYLQEKVTEEEKAQAAFESKPTERRSFRAAFLEKFDGTFKSYFSMGVWPAEKNPADNALMVFPLARKTTTDALVEQLGLSLKDFDVKQEQGLPFWIEKDSQTALTILDSDLLIANTPEAMHAALAHRVKKAPHVFENPASKDLIALLPRRRQGTFVLNNTPASRLVLGGMLGQSIAAESQAAGVGQVLPVTVGALQAQDDNVVSLRFLSPIHAETIANVEFRDSLRAAYQSTARFVEAGQLPPDTTLMVGVSRLDRVFDFYQRYFMPPEQSRSLKLAELVLAGFKIDLRQDLLGLFDQRTVMAARPINPSFMLVVGKDERKDKLLDKISALLSTNAFPVRQEMAQVGEVTVRTLSMGTGAQGPQQLSYGTVGRSLVFAVPDDYRALLEVGGNKAQTLAQSELYRSLMQGMPAESKAVAFADLRKQANGWIDGIGLSLWTETAGKRGELLNGQVNVKWKGFE